MTYEPDDGPLTEEDLARLRAAAEARHPSSGERLRTKSLLLDDTVEAWLRTTVVPAYDALKADPSRALTGEQIRASIRAQLEQVAGGSMTREALIAAVPVRESPEGRLYVRLDDVPAPWRAQFGEAMVGSAFVAVQGETCITPHAHDWEAWVHDRWDGRPGPAGLADE